MCTFAKEVRGKVHLRLYKAFENGRRQITTKRYRKFRREFMVSYICSERWSFLKNDKLLSGFHCFKCNFFSTRASVLSEVQTSRSSQLPASKNLLVLGDKESGKTTLVAKLQGNEDPKKGMAAQKI